MVFRPDPDYRVAVRKGDKGNDVAVLQLNLGNVVIDGKFGRETNHSVRHFQRSRNLVVDGIAGLATAKALVLERQRSATQNHNLPRGILPSICFNESSFILANAAKHHGDDGFDVGAYARSSGDEPGSSDFYRSAFDLKESAEWTARNLRERRRLLKDPVSSRYFEDLASTEGMFRWQLAVLSHNWPAGAFNICYRGGATVDFSGDVNRDDEPAEWIEVATRNPYTGTSALHTPRQWCMSYIAKATSMVRWR